MLPYSIPNLNAAAKPNQKPAMEVAPPPKEDMGKAGGVYCIHATPMPGSLHPLVNWWRNASGWSHGNDSPREAMSEGRLAEEAWNAAIDAAADCIVEDGNPMVALKRIKRLRYEPDNNP